MKTNEERELRGGVRVCRDRPRSEHEAYAGKLETDPDGYLIAKNLAESKHPGRFHCGRRRGPRLQTGGHRRGLGVRGRDGRGEVSEQAEAPANDIVGKRCCELFATGAFPE